MIPVDQTIVCKNEGDCMRAAAASLFELRIEQVPHFILFKDWFPVFYNYLRGLGYTYNGCRDGKLPILATHKGVAYASVKSRTYDDGTTHAVLIDQSGLVVHDPNPNKKFQGINVKETGELLYTFLIEPLD